MQHIKKKHIKLATLVLVASLIVGVCAVALIITLNVLQIKVGQVIPIPPPPKNYSVTYPTLQDAELNGIIQAHVKEEIDAFVKKAGSDTDQQSRMDLSYQPTHLGERTACYKFIKKVRHPNEPEKTVHRYVTLDYAAKKRLALRDIIKDDGSSREVLAWLLYDFFKHTPDAGLSQAQLTALYDFSIDDIRDLWITADSVVLSISPNDLKNKEAETKTVAIKKELIAAALHDPYATTDPDVEAVEPAPSVFAITSQPPPSNEIKPGERMVALTFDDGPVGLTSSVLDTLRRYGGRGTFFVLGSKVGGYAGVINRAIQEGNEIGNHSWSHTDLRTQSAAGLEHEIGDTQRAIQAATGGYTPRFMRPPYGATNGAVAEVIRKYGMTEELWTVDTKDWLDRNPQLIYDRIVGGAADGGVVLLHDIHPSSVEAINRAIPTLRTQGFQLVTLSELYRYRR